MDYAKYHFYMALFSFLISIGAMIHSLWSNREKVVKARFSGHDKRLESLERLVEKLPEMIVTIAAHDKGLARQKEALTAVESELKHLPKSSDIEKIYERMNQVNNQLADLKGEMGKIAGAMGGVVHTTEMMNEYLLKEGK